MLMKRLSSRILSGTLLVLTSMLPVGFVCADTMPDLEDRDELVELGERIYLRGVLSNGQPLSTAVPGILPGMDVACVRCHRRSGLGGREGGELVPALTGDYLFSNHLKLITKPVVHRIKRWAYTEASFDRALRQGIDVMGDPISQVMPRYALSGRDREALIAYLKTLVYRDKPGIEEETVHLATLIDSRLPEAERRALVDVAEKYVEVENRSIQAREKRAQFSERQNNWEVKSFRRWRLHVWTLQGEPATWQRQLEAYYQTQPVFILVGGAVAGEWEPVDEFCELQQMPCLLPHSDLPELETDSHFTFYFSRGLGLEAAALISHLREDKPHVGRLIQVYRDRADGRYAAQALRKDAAGLQLEDKVIPADGALSPENLQWMDGLSEKDAVMFWFDRPTLAQLTQLQDSGPLQSPLFASSILLGEQLEATHSPWDEKISLVHPFVLPWEPSAGISLGFLKKHGLLSETHFRLQSETFTAFAAVSQVMRRVRHNLVREYFMEQMEHLSEDLPATSVYPRFSLGPYQRVLSKGAYLFPLSELAQEQHGTRYPWVIPGQ